MSFSFLSPLEKNINLDAGAIVLYMRNICKAPHCLMKNVTEKGSCLK